MSTTVIIYISTALVSIIAAVLLFHITKLSGQARAKFDRISKKSSPSFKMDDSLRQTIFDEVNEYVDSQRQGQEISRAISGVFGKELEKRVDHVKGEINAKYQEIMDQKGKSEDIAWKKYNKLLGDQKRTEAVIRSIAEGLVVVDSKGKVVMMNPAAEKLLDVSRKEKVGKSVLEDLKGEELVTLSKDVSDDQSKEIELTSQQDETKKILRASSAVIEDESGKTVGMVSVLSDITKQKKLDLMKEGFIANVSHELRTPIVAVEKSLSLILSKAAGEITPTQKQFLSIAERNLKRLNVLVNDLLDLSKLEAGKMEFKESVGSLEEVINESVEVLRAWADSKSIKINTKIPKNLPQVKMDSNRLIQVLNNLIGNAIKYTPNQGVVTVEATPRNQEVQVMVQDTGIGIEEKNLPKIFDKFYQVGERTPTDIGGTGIGLSIAKEIIEQHGGRIWAESEKGQGARFVFRLPLN